MHVCVEAVCPVEQHFLPVLHLYSFSFNQMFETDRILKQPSELSTLKFYTGW